MIIFDNVWKTFKVRGGRKDIFRGLSVTLRPDRNIGIIGINGAGKSTFLNILGGALKPDRGTVTKNLRTSWPMGFAGGFHSELTGRQNARFVSRIYGADTASVEDFVEDFSELGQFFDMPFRTYSAGMKARLAFGVSMAAHFECYLVDEITGVGDARFRAKCHQVFRDRLASSQVIMVSHSEQTLRSYCQSALLLDQGEATFYEDISEALEIYNRSQEA